MRRQVPEGQLSLSLAKRFLTKPPQPKKPRRKPENLEEWVVFSGKLVVRAVKATSHDQAIAYLRREFGISVGSQGYAKRRSDFPDDVVIYPGMTENQCLGIE